VEHPPAPREPRTIRRYANRKLYDTAESRYVTLQDVEALVRGGVEVRVVDNRTGEDVTQAALAQILCDAGRRRDPRYSLGTILALFRRPEFELRVREFLRLGGEGGRTDPPPAAVAAAGPSPGTPPWVGSNAASDPVSAGASVRPPAESESVRDEVVAGWVRRAEDVQRRIDDLVNRIVRDFGPLRRIGSRLRALEDRLAALEKAVARRSSSRGRGRRTAGRTGR